MKKLVLVLALASVASSVQAQEIRVLEVTPRYRTYMETRCHNEQVTTNNSGVGTVIGGVAGGIIGNQVGKGSGKDVATVAGAIVGGMVGNRIGNDQQNIETRQVCNQIPVTTVAGETVKFSYKNKVYTFVTE